VLLLDEPFAALDVELRKDLAAHLAALKSGRGMTMLWVSQRHEEALALADRLLLLRSGRVAENGEVRSVLAHPRTAFGARFLVDANLVRARVERTGRARSVLGEIECAQPGPDGSVLVAVSPDAFAVSANGRVRGTVESAEFRGRYFAYVVRVGNERLRVHLKERIERGETVSLRLMSEPCVVEDE